MLVCTSYLKLLLCIATVIIFPLLSEANANACDGYKCLRKLEKRDTDELDEICRNNQVGLDRFCYCCGGVTNYFIYGNICNRYCLKYFNRNEISFTKPCHLKNEKQIELRERNERKLEPFDDDGNYNYDDPFPTVPLKMEVDFIECKNLDYEEPTPYEDFAKGIDGSLGVRLDSDSDVLIDADPNVWAKSIHDFTQAMLSQMLKEEKNENFVFSPFSLHVTLAMLTSSSTDNSTTQNELLKALGRTQNIQTLSASYKELLEEYEENNNLISFGNGIWTRKNFFDLLENEFLEILDAHYFAEFNFFNLRDPVFQINDWVNRTTRGRIESLVDDVSEEVQVLLTNALYFKDAWTKAFEMVPSEPKRMFTLLNGTEIDVTSKMMFRDSSDFLLVTNLTLDGLNSNFRFTVVSIPYNSLDKRFEMIILMPEDRKGLAVLEDFLYKTSFSETNDNYENMMDQITRNLELARKRERQPIDVEIPMFSISTDVSVLDYMEKMGVKDAFNIGDFDKLTKKEKLKVNAIKHKAVIEVTKEGTTGVAATGVEIGVLSANFFQKTAYINKPFLFFVRDRRSENILFAGNVKNPLS